jgi:hypothetical protein
MEEYVDFNFTYFNLDTEEMEIVTHSIPLEVAEYIEDMGNTIHKTSNDYYALKAKLNLLTHTLKVENKN